MSASAALSGGVTGSVGMGVRPSRASTPAGDEVEEHWPAFLDREAGFSGRLVSSSRCVTLWACGAVRVRFFGCEGVVGRNARPSWRVAHLVEADAAA